MQFTIAPGDVAIPPIALSGGETLQYALDSPINGVMQPSDSGRIITFSASISATLEGSQGNDGTQTYFVPFTTESVSASTPLGSVQTSGMRLDEDARYAQIVGATQNSSSATPQPGKAVYTVLSGSFDQLPE